MKYLGDIVLIILLFSVFAISHSVLASLWFKNKLVDAIKEKIAFYRLFYNLISVIVFVAVYYLMPKPDVIIYDLQFPYDIIILVMQYLSLFGLVYVGFKIDGKEFLGISQIKRYINGTYKLSDLDEQIELRTDGIFAFSRHPIYLFSILFLGLRPYMDLFYFVLFICITVYFYVGAYFEEKKLTKIFGNNYVEYQNKVPAILPIKFKFKD
jgi:protein-S-isoprenylcysteine O-methyltransferase Ste14